MGVRSLGNALASFGYKFGTTGLEAVSSAEPAAPASFSASGGTTTTFGSYKANHIFESGTSDNFVVASGSKDIDLLVVGGGGGGADGGPGQGGGGGAGAVIYEPGFPVTPGTYPITIGAGGASGRPGSRGGTTSFSTTHIAYGGGGGGGGARNRWWFWRWCPIKWNSGKWWWRSNSTKPGNATLYGNQGGQPNGPGGGGGGGAGAAGADGTVAAPPGNKATAGGAGIQINIVPGSTGPAPAPASGYYWGGGGGGDDGGHEPSGINGGLGGGGGSEGADGTGGAQAWTAGSNGVNDAAGAGGGVELVEEGGGASGGGDPGGNGGSGIIILRYQV